MGSFLLQYILIHTCEILRIPAINLAMDSRLQSRWAILLIERMLAKETAQGTYLILIDPGITMFLSGHDSGGYKSEP